MTVRAFFLADGSSDLPISRHLETLCRRKGHPMQIVPVRADRLPEVGRTVAARVRAVLTNDPDFRCVFVHRDAERQSADRRYREVENGVRAAGFTGQWLAVVPVRMTEAWLLLDEPAIRRVAGRPSGQEDLGLPSPRDVEELPDPKSLLQQALVTAGQPQGRRRKIFRSQFAAHRRRLLEQLDLDGPVTLLSAWHRLDVDLDTTLAGLATG